jgi:hypothetical protein
LPFSWPVSRRACAAKYADLVLLLIDGGFGFEMETFEFLNLLQVSEQALLGRSRRSRHPTPVASLAWLGSAVQ